MRARTGVVPQTDNLDTVAENLRVYGRYFSLPARVLDSRPREPLEFVGLADRADAQFASSLSVVASMERRSLLPSSAGVPVTPW